MFATQLYEPDECAGIVERVKPENGWEAAQIVVESEGRFLDLTLPDTRAARILERTHASDIYEEFERRVASCIQPLVHQNWGVDLYRQEGTQLIRYSPGGHFVAHRDADEGDLACRYFTVLCYLNDNFEGGRTTFTSLDFVAAPVPGKTLVFPSRYMHCAEPVTKGEKFVLITWLCGPIPIKWI